VSAATGKPEGKGGRRPPYWQTGHRNGPEKSNACATKGKDCEANFSALGFRRF
jgi:hypothetical protein